MRVFEERARLKNDSVSYLTEAYALLSERVTEINPASRRALKDQPSLANVSQELFETFWKLVRLAAEELHKTCDRADGFAAGPNSLFFYRWVLEELDWFPALCAEHRHDVTLLMQESEKADDSSKLLLPWICQRALDRLRKVEKWLVQKKANLLPTFEALVEVRDSRLYRQDFDSFEDYCRGRWGLEPQIVEAISQCFGHCDAGRRTT